MNRTCCNILIAGMALLVIAATIFAADPAPPAKKNYGDRYNVLSERNIFMRERGRPATRPYTPRTYDSATVRPPLEASFVLTGIVLEEGQYRAYVEDVSSGRVNRLAVGDAIARGHVLEIEIDAIAYSAGGQGTWISIGSDLRGQAFNSFPTAMSRYLPTAPTTSSVAATTGPSGTATGGAPPPPLDPNTAGLSVEERMRLRRLQGK
jgi:hypothetical protein